jgi:hypothetical protein
MGITDDKSGLDQLAKNLQRLDGTRNVAFEEIFPNRFMRKYTKFASIDEMFEKGGFKVESQADFEAVPEADLNRFVVANTRFRSWEDMLGKASEEYALRQLGLG